MRASVAKDTFKLQFQCRYASLLWKDLLLESFVEPQTQNLKLLWFLIDRRPFELLQVIYLACLSCYTVASGCTSGDSSKLLFKSETIDTLVSLAPAVQGNESIFREVAKCHGPNTRNVFEMGHWVAAGRKRLVAHSCSCGLPVLQYSQRNGTAILQRTFGPLFLRRTAPTQSGIKYLGTTHCSS
jgi:hypothetical protein